MKYYKLPDTLPAWNYFKILETGDPRYLLILEDYFSLPADVNIELLSNAYLEIMFAMPEGSYDLSFKREELQLAKLKNKAISIGGKYDTLANVQENKVKRLIKELEDNNKTTVFNINDEIITIEGILNLTIDPMICSISKFISYRKRANEKNEALRKQQESRDKKRA